MEAILTNADLASAIQSKALKVLPNKKLSKCSNYFLILARNKEDIEFCLRYISDCKSYIKLSPNDLWRCTSTIYQEYLKLYHTVEKQGGDVVGIITRLFYANDPEFGETFFQVLADACRESLGTNSLVLETYVP